MMPRVSGFTIVRNATVLDFPLEASIRSVLPLVDEFVVVVGESDDDTRDRVTALADDRIRIVDSVWDFGNRYRVLAVETDRAIAECTGDWGCYIQADEVLHHDTLPILARDIARYDDDPRVEGLVVKYRHFYGTPEVMARARRWYRQEVRVVRLPPAVDVHSHEDAQGFRVGPEKRKLRVALTDAWMHHYGWARPDPALIAKASQHPKLYHDPEGASSQAGSAAPQSYLLPWEPGLRPYHGSHPKAALGWISTRSPDPVERILPRRLAWRHLRDYFSIAWENLTGRLPFEYRNFQVVARD